MIIKLADATTDGLYITNISKSLFLNEFSNGDASPIEKISIGVEKATITDYETYRDFFQNGDVSKMEVYNSAGELLAIFYGKELESISHNLNEDKNNIHISITV